MSQELASAVERTIGSFRYGSQFMNVCLSTTIFPVHWMTSPALRRSCSSAASAVIGLNVEPGG